MIATMVNTVCSNTYVIHIHDYYYSGLKSHKEVLEKAYMYVAFLPRQILLY